jgi:hypothetical protein
MDSAIVRAAGRELPATLSFRRFALVLLGFAALPPLLLAAIVIAVDPYYVFGSPSLRGINVVRPYYETNIFSAKLYQTQRMRPGAVALGSSRVEVGLDPRHPGWVDSRTFNFALPGSTSYEIMLAFLHAQAVGRPLKQAVVGLDFFGFNIFFPRSRAQQEARFGRDEAQAFADFLADELRQRQRGDSITISERGLTPAITSPRTFNVQIARDGHLGMNAQARAEPQLSLPGIRGKGRSDGTPPSNWDEAGYLQINPDVITGIEQGRYTSGYQHFITSGGYERRVGGFQPAEWNEAGYLAANPEVRAEIALGAFRTGYLHYAALGRTQGLVGGLPPADALEALRLQSPTLNWTLLQIDEIVRLIFSRTAARASIATVLRQSMPAPFDDAGVRLFPGQEELLRRLGGTGHLIRSALSSGAWGPWLNVPRFMYCFTNADTGMTTFDAFRFMLRRAYAEGTDLRMFVTPVHAVVRVLQQGLGIGERYEFWLKELVRINEEEAALAGKPPLPLWDFSDPNTVTREPVPTSGDLTPMRWFWEHSHYRKVTGDLVLDRLFGYSKRERPLPADFGVRLTAANVDAHITRARDELAVWASANSDLVSPIVRAAQSLKTLNRQAEATCW